MECFRGYRVKFCWDRGSVSRGGVRALLPCRCHEGATGRIGELGGAYIGGTRYTQTSGAKLLIPAPRVRGFVGLVDIHSVLSGTLMHIVDGHYSTVRCQLGFLPLDYTSLISIEFASVDRMVTRQRSIG